MKLKDLRKANKKSQTEIAKYLNISQSNYGKYELQTVQPDIETLCKLADLYNVSLDYLVGREFKDDIGYLTPDQKNVLYAIKQLNGNNLNIILSQALKLINEQ